MFRNKLTVICLLVAGCSLICAQSAAPALNPIDNPKVQDAETTEAARPTTKTTPTTTSTSTTTTTAAPQTTTAAPNTTTLAPTTSTAVPSTTPAPTPVPTPDIGKWNTSCIMLQMATQLNFTYETSDNKNATAIYNIPSSAIVHDVTCDSNTTQQIVLTWGPVTAVHSMTMQFERNNSNVNVYMIMFRLPIDSATFPNAKANETVQLIYHGDLFEAPYHMSYHCTRVQKFNLTETINDETPVGTVMLSDVQMEAFRDNNSTKFSEARDCDSSETPDIVPIAVGIALIALILIVLISYLCARRRSTARGYMSF